MTTTWNTYLPADTLRKIRKVVADSRKPGADYGKCRDRIVTLGAAYMEAVYILTGKMVVPAQPNRTMMR